MAIMILLDNLKFTHRAKIINPEDGGSFGVLSHWLQMQIPIVPIIFVRTC